MKRLVYSGIFILLLTVFAVSNKTTLKVYCVGHVIVDGDTISYGNRTRFDLTKDDVEEYLAASLAENSFVTSHYW